MDILNEVDKIGFIDKPLYVYNVENEPFYSSDDKFYLSFILRGGGDDSEYNLNFASGGFANERYDRSGGGEVGNYGYFNDRQVPHNAWSGSVLANPQVTGSKYQRYIFQAKQHFFSARIMKRPLFILELLKLANTLNTI